MSKSYSPAFLAFLTEAVALYETRRNSFGIPLGVYPEAKKSGWFGSYRDWQCLTSEGHAEAKAVLAEQGLSLPASPAYHELPLYARVAFERVSQDSSLRTVSMVDELLAGYAKTYGVDVDEEVREVVLAVCQDRFPEAFSEPAPARVRAASQDEPGPSF